jgi:hypothetical protein
MIFLRRQIAQAYLGLVHQQNDEESWAAAKRIAAPILRGVQQNEGLDAFDIACDKTTQNPAIPNTMFVNISVQPTPEADRILTTFGVYNGTVTVS